MKKTQSAISILHNLRKQLANKQRFNKLVSTTMLGLIMLDFILIKYVKNSYDTLFAIAGVVLIFGWFIVSLIGSIQLQKEITNIDEFYLELEQRIIKQNETKQKTK